MTVYKIRIKQSGAIFTADHGANWLRTIALLILIYEVFKIQYQVHCQLHHLGRLCSQCTPSDRMRVFSLLLVGCRGWLVRFEPGFECQPDQQTTFQQQLETTIHQVQISKAIDCSFAGTQVPLHRPLTLCDRMEVHTEQLNHEVVVCKKQNHRLNYFQAEKWVIVVNVSGTDCFFWVKKNHQNITHFCFDTLRCF